MNTAKRSALLVCEELPLPNFAGHTTYNRAFVHALTQAGFEVSVFVTGHRFGKPFFSAAEEVGISGIRTIAPHAFNLFGDRFCVGPRGLLRLLLQRSGMKRLIQRRDGGARVQIGKWLADRHVQTRLRALIRRCRPDYLLVDTIFRSPVLDGVPPQTAKLLIGHDVFHQRCAALVESGLTPSPYVSYAEEAFALSRFDGVIAITENDAHTYRSMQPALPVLDLAAPIAVRAAPPPRPDSKRILYVGSRAQVNVDGLNWFLRDIWPSVRAGCPEARLDVVGSVCSELAPDTPGTVLHGRVDDFAALADRAMFAINPVRAGSGLKIKMLDYFAHGLGCVTTPAGASGFPLAADSPIEICIAAQNFADTCQRWLESLDLCQRQSAHASVYARQFSFESFSEKLLGWVGNLSALGAAKTS